MVVIRVEQGWDPTRLSPNSPYFIDDRANKIANTNITGQRSCIKIGGSWAPKRHTTSDMEFSIKLLVPVPNDPSS